MAVVLCTAPHESVAMRNRGISLAFLLQLVEQGMLKPSWTILEAVQLFVRPATAQHNCCLHDLVPAEHIGQPEYFVSHTW